jgi:hypothetical protein
MTNKSSTSNTENPRVYGGMTLAWLLGEEPRAVTTKTGDVRTVIELRDPKRLSNSITIWLDGDAKAFEHVSHAARTPSRSLTSVLPGRSHRSPGRWC